MTQRSTTLNQAALYCLKALDHYDNGVSYDRAVFSTGIAAHAVFQNIGEYCMDHDLPDEEQVQAIASATARRLATEGRSFDGVPEPPLPVQATLAGARLALDWYRNHGVAQGEHMAIEYGAAVDAKWNATEYRGNAYYRGIFDVCFESTEEGEDFEVHGITVCDAKTSWRDRDAKLESVQLHGQGLLALALYRQRHGADPGFIRRQIANFRTGVLHEDTTYDLSIVDFWREELDLAIAQAETRPRIASPGTNCWGCPYLAHCDDAKRYLWGGFPADPKEIAIRYAVAKSTVAECEKYLREATTERPINGIGYYSKDGVEPHEAAPERIMAAWGVTDERVLGLLKAMKPGVTAIRSVARTLHRGQKKRQDALVETLTRGVVKVRFGMGVSDDYEDEEKESSESC